MSMSATRRAILRDMVAAAQTTPAEVTDEQIDTLAADVLDAYRERGWMISEFDHVGYGHQTVGPCAARCGRNIIRYGPYGQAFCSTCRARR